MATPFETEPCRRCGGSGTHSYCSMWGTTCFDCGSTPGVPGSGRRLTKRGKAALAHFKSLLPTKTAATLAVGDKLRGDLLVMAGGNHRYVRTVLTVTEIKPTTGWGSTTVNGVTTRRDASTGCVDVVTDKMVYSCVKPTRTFDLAPTVAERDAALEAALAYEKTLTKTGKPMKRAKKAVDKASTIA